MMRTLAVWLLLAVVVAAPAMGEPGRIQGYDIRGPWVGSAQGTIFGAKGSVLITHQVRDDIFGVVEGGNAFGSARFDITGKVQGNQIFGQKDGHTFRGFLYEDGTIRGTFRSVDGDAFRVILQRPYSQWGMGNSGSW
jgi:hypothetical protein